MFLIACMLALAVFLVYGRLCINFDLVKVNVLVTFSVMEYLLGHVCHVYVVHASQHNRKY